MIRYKASFRSLSNEKGVAILEVVIAIFVIAVGFLALLKLQMTSMNGVTSANQRYIAANLAQAMAERIRASAGDYDGMGTDAFNKNCEVPSSCSVVENDMYQWKKDLAEVRDSLPEGKGEITKNNLTQRVLVKVEWKEKMSQHDVVDVAFALEVATQ